VIESQPASQNESITVPVRKN